MSESNWDGWNEAIKNMEMPKREPIWLGYLMGSRYMMEWDGEKWRSIA